MVTVEFRSVRAGTCQWCRKEKDQVYDVAFGDRSFIGQMCKADLLRAIDMKLPVEAAKPEAKPAVAVPAGNGQTK